MKMSHDEIIYDMLDFAIPRYFDALNILFANRDWMPRFVDQSGNERMVIIEKIKMDEEIIIDAIHKAREKWKKQTQEVKNILKNASEKNLNEITKQLIPKMFDPQALSAGLMTIDVVEGITADLLYSCLENYSKQNKYFDDKKILSQLSHDALRLIEPLIQVGVCGYCHNFELLALCIASMIISSSIFIFSIITILSFPD